MLAKYRLNVIIKSDLLFSLISTPSDANGTQADCHCQRSGQEYLNGITVDWEHVTSLRDQELHREPEAPNKRRCQPNNSAFLMVEHEFATIENRPENIFDTDSDISSFCGKLR